MTRNMDGEQLQEIIDRCVQRLLNGESLEHILLSYPDIRSQLTAALEPARALLQATVAEPSPRARGAAMNAMLRQVRTEAERPALPGIFAWIGTLRARPLAFQAFAVVAAIMVFSGVGIGASAATGGGPEPVRTLLGLSSNSSSSVRLSGPIVSLENGTLVLRTQAGERSVSLTSSTAIHRAQLPIDLSALAVGEHVDVTATEHNGTATAREIHTTEDPDTPTIGAAGLPEGANTATDTPAGEPTTGNGGHQDDGASPTTGRDDGYGDRSSTPSSSTTPGGVTRTPERDGATTTPEPTTPEPRTPASSPTPSGEHDHGD